MMAHETLPLVVVVGRPNVGKSALFNRLARRRIAIVHTESGVTRDRIVCTVSSDDCRFELVDTGGIQSLDGEAIPDPVACGVRAQVQVGLRAAVLALLVVDAREGLHPMDEEIAGQIRRLGIPALVLANKCDHDAHEPGAAVFARLGFPVFEVSALHDRGFSDVLEALSAVLPPAGPATDAAEGIRSELRIAVVGRPNVGKSSYVNRLLGDTRVIVSERPGTTRDSIDIPFVFKANGVSHPLLLIDTAGMRKMRRVDEAVERYSQFRAQESIRRSDVVVLMMEAGGLPTVQDKHIAARIAEAHRAAVLVVNKWDRMSGSGLHPREYVLELRRLLPFMARCPVVCVSALSGENVRRSLSLLVRVATHARMPLPTGVLNRALGDATERVPPPGNRGKSLKVYYAAQVGVNPQRIRVFVNDPGRVRPAYRDYLERALQERFGLGGIPIVFQFRARRESGGGLSK